jgi:hypothetical protein
LLTAALGFWEGFRRNLAATRKQRFSVHKTATTLGKLAKSTRSLVAFDGLAGQLDPKRCQ